jgi:hypothetical protein
MEAGLADHVWTLEEIMVHPADAYFRPIHESLAAGIDSD